MLQQPCRGPALAKLPTSTALFTFMTVSRQGTVQSVLRPGLGSVMTLHANCSPLSRCVATRTVE